MTLTLPVINIKQLGTKADGIADDFPIIQGAIDKAALSGSMAVLPPGTYAISQPLNIHCNFDGRGAVLIVLFGNQGYTITDASKQIFTPDVNVSGVITEGGYNKVDVLKKKTGTLPPVSGAWNAGDIVYNSNPAIGTPIGWVCISSGSPGTWEIISYVGDTLNVQTILPTPSASQHGKTILLDNGTGKGDSFYTCVKTAAGTYVWVSLSFRITDVQMPNSGTWNMGDIVYNATPVFGQPFGWVCTASGSPGSWEVISYVGATISVQNTLPIASALYHGKFIILNNGSGKADSVYTCVKLADDTYTWSLVLLSTPGVTPTTWASSPPTTGNWTVNAVVYNFAPALGSPIGWICIESGSPGGWTPIDYVGQTLYGKDLILKSPGGTKYALSVDSIGAIVTTSVTSVSAGSTQVTNIPLLSENGSCFQLSINDIGALVTAPIAGSYGVETIIFQSSNDDKFLLVVDDNGVLVTAKERGLDPTSGSVSDSRVLRISPPVSGSWESGDLIYNSNPSFGTPIGWVCSQGGVPGTWVPIGYIGTTLYGKNVVLTSPIGTNYALSVNSAGALITTVTNSITADSVQTTTIPLLSPNGSCFQLSINDSGSLITAPIAGSYGVENVIFYSDTDDKFVMTVDDNGKLTTTEDRVFDFVVGNLTDGRVLNATPPASGKWRSGDLVYNSSPSFGTPLGWVCSQGGTPGLWIPIGYVGKTLYGKDVILQSQNGTNYALSVDAVGNLVTTATDVITTDSMQVTDIPLLSDSGACFQLSIDNTGTLVTAPIDDSSGIETVVFYSATNDKFIMTVDNTGHLVTTQEIPIDQPTPIQVWTVSSLPAASKDWTGKPVYLPGGAGVADGYYFCKKNADGTYDWIQFA